MAKKKKYHASYSDLKQIESELVSRQEKGLKAAHFTELAEIVGNYLNLPLTAWHVTKVIKAVDELDPSALVERDVTNKKRGQFAERIREAHTRLDDQRTTILRLAEEIRELKDRISALEGNQKLGDQLEFDYSNNPGRA